MYTKVDVIVEIKSEINKIKRELDNGSWSDANDATNRVALSNLYIALSNLIK